jgi:transcriptional antiterminator NusG
MPEHDHPESETQTTTPAIEEPAVPAASGTDAPPVSVPSQERPAEVPAAEPEPEPVGRAEPEPEQPAPAAEDHEEPEDSQEDEEAEAAAAEQEEEEAEAAAPAEPPPEPSKKRWYVVKVQTGREESIRDAIERRVKIEGLEEFYGQIVIPMERVTEMRNNRRVTKERKLYPGYLMVEVEYNDRILYLFRETSGVGDFVGGTVNRPPPPMSDREVERMIGITKAPEEAAKVIHAKPKFGKGDRVKVTDGTFAGMTGEVKELHEAEATVSVELRIFDRPVDVKMEYWQVELA